MAVLKDLIVHGNSRFINTAQFNSLKANTIGADQGIFNKLIATSADIGTLDVDDLTAQNATVVGLLDVQGNLHTNSWTNSNISTIQGNFYIAPTVKTSTSSNDSGFTLAAVNSPSSSNGYWTITIGGTNIFSVPNLESDAVNSGDSAYNSWSSGSLVMVTGSIVSDGVTYPLGTLKGELSGAITANGATITKITDDLNNNPATLQELGAGTYGFQEVKISLYKRFYGSELRPLGILMSAEGRASKSFIDIYGGANKTEEGILSRTINNITSTASSDYGGLALPNVRIGNLRGLPNILTGDFTSNAGLPTGWGIYTSNGYFSGTIAATSGYIGTSDTYVQVLKDEEGDAYLDIRVSQLQFLSGERYGQENVVDVLDLIIQQKDFIELWNGNQIWFYTLNDVTYTVYEFFDEISDETKYFYNSNEYLSGDSIEENWVEISYTTLTNANATKKQLNGLANSLKFIDDSLGNQQCLVVSSANNNESDEEQEKAWVEIDPQFINFAIRDEDMSSLELKIGQDQTSQTGFVSLNYGDESIFNIKDENNYMLSTTTGFKFGGLGMFYYKDGLAIGIV